MSIYYDAYVAAGYVVHPEEERCLCNGTGWYKDPLTDEVRKCCYHSGEEPQNPEKAAQVVENLNEEVDGIFCVDFAFNLKIEGDGDGIE